MKLSRKGLLLLVVAFAAVIVVLVQSFNTLAGKNREQVHQELQKTLGKDISFAQLDVSLVSGLGFSAKEFRIADDPRFAATPFVRARELVLGVSLWNLLVGRIVINSLTFQEPEFQIITDEEGLLNLSVLASRKKDLGAFPRLRNAAPERRQPAVRFLVTKMRIRNGRFDFIDRSVKEPAEMRIKNVEMEVKGLDLAGRTRIKFAAAVTEGLGHDVRIEGQLGPVAHDRAWSQQPIDLEIQFDSLHVPVIARAIAFLRNKIPRELDVTGPLSLRAKLTGSLERPRITDITLKGPLFGSSDYNATLTGLVDHSESRSWAEAKVQGMLTLAPLNLKQLRTLSFFQQTLPAALVAEGAISVYSRFEGTWEHLRVGALIKADKGEFRYRNWLRKPAGTTAQLRAAISWQKQGLMLHDSVLSLGDSKMKLSGIIAEAPERRLQLALRSDRSHLAAWSHLFPPRSFYGIGGSADWDIVIHKNFASADRDWNVRGKLNFTNAEFRHKESGRKIESLNAQISFLGRQARVENAVFRLGSSSIAMAATATNLTEPSVSYELRSPDLSLSDLPALPVLGPARLKNVTAIGEIQAQNGVPSLKGAVSSPEGSLQQILYRNLRADVTWSPTSIGFNNLSLQTLNGTLRSDGYWVFGDEQYQRFKFMSQIESVEVQSLLALKFPQLKNPIQGQLDFRGQFDAATRNGAPLQEALKGSGETLIHHGTIRDFNLIAWLFIGSSGASAQPSISSRLPASLAALVNRQHTPFDVLKANFTVEQQRIRTDNLLLSTPDYTITGAGWVGFDRTTQWNGLLVLSPRAAQELQREYKAIRFLLDRRGRLSVSFRVEGKLPNVKIRPENRALAQIFRWGISPRANEPAAAGGKGQEKKEGKERLPESLEQLLK